jgi:LysR family transcriptional activator of nhaA
MRRSLNLWFDRKRIHPLVVGEFDDSATMFSFGQEGAGVFPVPSVVAARIEKERGVQFVGVADKVREQFYAITVEEKPAHPAVVAICETSGRDVS